MITSTSSCQDVIDVATLGIALFEQFFEVLLIVCDCWDFVCYSCVFQRLVESELKNQCFSRMTVLCASRSESRRRRFSLRYLFIDRYILHIRTVV